MWLILHSKKRWGRHAGGMLLKICSAVSIYSSNATASSGMHLFLFFFCTGEFFRGGRNKKRLSSMMQKCSPFNSKRVSLREKGRECLIQARDLHPFGVKRRGKHAQRSGTIQMRFNLIRLKPDLVWLLCCRGRCRRRHFILVINAKKYTRLDCEGYKNTNIASKVKQRRKKTASYTFSVG